VLHPSPPVSYLSLLQSATDFTNALKLDPTSKDLPSLLQKSKDKYLEVEGRGEWKERAGAGGDTNHSEDAVFTVVPTVCGSKKDFMSYLLCEDMGELLAEGSCVYSEVPVIRSSEPAFTRVAITFDDDDEEEEEGEGEVVAQEEVRGDSSSRASGSAAGTAAGSSSSISNSSSAKNVGLKKVEKEEVEASFTRIQITDDDDDDDDNLEGEKNGGMEKPTGASSMRKGEKQKEKEVEKEVGKPADTAAATATATAFTRISISDEDDDTEGEEGISVIETEKIVTAQKAAIASVIEEKVISPKHPVPSSSSSSASTPTLQKASDKIQSAVPHTSTTTTSSGSAGVPSSESLKIAGNEEMKNCNYPAALSLYTASLELDQSNLLTRNNRSQVYLKLNQYQNAVDDATYVIMNDPSHPRVLGPKFVPSSVSPAVKKALFRRATVRET
jgi:tetratricopeptide (TPR) repeat protein